MNDTVTVRRLGAGEAFDAVEGLADVLIDCVEGGASVSFMLPLARDKALAFWRGSPPASHAANAPCWSPRTPWVRSSAPCSSSWRCRTTSPTGPTSPRCWSTAAPAAQVSPGS